MENREVTIGSKDLKGVLRHPRDAHGLVIFAHGAGSSRLSPRNTYVANRLAERGLASLLFDLLTADETQIRDNVFDIPLLSVRMIEAIKWARNERELSQLKIGLFGSSTGAAAAFVAAAKEAGTITAIVSRGGRPDLAGEALAKVTAPTLLVVGGADPVVIELNMAAAKRLKCPNELVLVPGATHLFEEPGTLDEVVKLAADWFEARFNTKGAPG